MKEGYIPREQRKKILLITDDIRANSGVGGIGREIVIHTSHHYNWVCIGGAMNHPDKGKRFDLSGDTNKNNNIEDASVILYPTDGYGNPDLIRFLIKEEKIDAIFLITDPRYFVWLFQMEGEIRKRIPIVYLNIWDDLPAPMYNKEFYESCDALLAISKQTLNINKTVLGDKAKGKVIEYLPHGLNDDYFFTLKTDHPSYNDFVTFKEQLFNKKQPKFVALFNSRNIHRKHLPDAILAWKMFCDKIGPEKAKDCAFVLHTQALDDHGTDIPAVLNYLFPDDCNVYITNGHLPINQMNYLYNLADVGMLLSSNEGWGLMLTECLLTGTPFIANVTGGMQDQMRFENKNGNWIDFDENVPSNHRGTYKTSGEWAFPVFPSSISLQGSIPTPYIFDDRCKPEEAAEQLFNAYSVPKEELKARGLKGQQWALSDEAGFTSKHQASRVMLYVDKLFSTWTPRKKYELVADTDYEKRVLKHKLIY